MKLFLFVDPISTPVQALCAKKLDERFLFLVDSVHGYDKAWLKRNFVDLQYACFTCPSKVDPLMIRRVCIDLSLDKFGCEWESALMVVCLQKGEEIRSSDFDLLVDGFLSYLQSEDDGFKDVSDDGLKVLERVDCFKHVSDVGLEMLERVDKEKIMQKPLESSYDYQDVDIKKPRFDAYGFDFEVNPAQDVAVCEIQKPNVDQPYCVVLRHFSRDGYLKLFSSLFICPSWGVAREDHAFLKALWKELKMEGECDLEKLVKEHTESCRPDASGHWPTCEPEVYRLDLKDTIKQLERKRKNMLA